ncbi:MULTISPECIES: hypothetical protein [unclassified Pseudomonas]|uniref:hypothetical protein n=1 Tax=unclassified Pseudomonas TaxID=196821 RepID=UPI002555EC93|nr:MULTISPECIES: hypothetical protein [unclassified Pseudomonas]
MRVKLLNASTLLRFALKAVLLGGAGALPAMAAELDIRAEFRPDPAQPHLNKFENKTPNVGFCVIYPGQCTSLNIHSLRAPIRVDSVATIPALHTDPRQGAMFKVPTDWRDLTVVHRQTQEVETVKVRIVGIGSTYGVPNLIEVVGGGVGVAAAHSLLWGGRWVYPPVSCLGTGWGTFFGQESYAFFWRVPDGSVCAKQAKFDIPRMTYSHLEFTYELTTPNPLGMSSGEYTGSYQYTVGPNQDFDMGDVMLPNDSLLTLNFTLNVEHDLKVEVPPGGNRIELVPQGGWQAWLNQGRKPARLFRDQTFTISASSRFKMQLECERVMGDTCALRNAAGHQVPLNLSVSLPNGLNRPDGSAVSRQPLLLSGAGTEQFDPRYYVNRRPGTLHFEVAREHTETMLAQGGSTYSGQATVIWDSEL